MLNFVSLKCIIDSFKMQAILTRYITVMLCVASCFSGDMEDKDEEGTCSIYPVCCYSTLCMDFILKTTFLLRLWWFSSLNKSLVWNNKCTANILQCSVSVLSRMWPLRQWLRCGHICSWEVTFPTPHCCHIHKIPRINECSWLQRLDFLSRH